MLTLSNHYDTLPYSDVVVVALQACRKRLPAGIQIEEFEGVAWAAYSRFWNGVAGKAARNNPGGDARGLLFIMIKNALMDELRRWGHSITREQKMAMGDVAKARESLAELLGRDPCMEEIAQVTGISETRVKFALQREHVSNAAPIIPDSPDGPRSPQIASGDLSPAEEVVSREAQSFVRTAIGLLRGRESAILTAIYLDEIPIREIANTQGITVARVYQLRDKALGKLRTLPGVKDLLGK